MSERHSQPGPPDERARVRDWTDLMRRIRFHPVKVAGKVVTSATVKAVAASVADYSDGNGTRVFPGLARIAVDLEKDYRTVMRAMQRLVDVGLLRLVRAGTTRGNANEYELTLPVDLFDREDIEVWSPARYEAEVRRVADENRGARSGSRGGPQHPPVLVPQGPADVAVAVEVLVPQGPAEVVDNSIALVPEGPAVDGPDEDRAGPSGTRIADRAGPSGTPVLVPGGPATHHYPSQVLPTTPGDVRTDLAVVRVPEAEPEKDSNLSVGRCDHGFAVRYRDDGASSCALCRREAARPALQLLAGGAA